MKGLEKHNKLKNESSYFRLFYVCETVRFLGVLSLKGQNKQNTTETKIIMFFWLFTCFLCFWNLQVFRCPKLWRGRKHNKIQETDMICFCFSMFEKDRFLGALNYEGAANNWTKTEEKNCVSFVFYVLFLFWWTFKFLGVLN